MGRCIRIIELRKSSLVMNYYCNYYDYYDDDDDDDDDYYYYYYYRSLASKQPWVERRRH